VVNTGYNTPPPLTLPSPILPFSCLTSPLFFTLCSHPLPLSHPPSIFHLSSFFPPSLAEEVLFYSLPSLLFLFITISSLFSSSMHFFLPLLIRLSAIPIFSFFLFHELFPPASFSSSFCFSFLPYHHLVPTMFSISVVYFSFFLSAIPFSAPFLAVIGPYQPRCCSYTVLIVFACTVLNSLCLLRSLLNLRPNTWT
jgi:hypothetical protein